MYIQVPDNSIHIFKIKFISSPSHPQISFSSFSTLFSVSVRAAHLSSQKCINNLEQNESKKQGRHVENKKNKPVDSHLNVPLLETKRENFQFTWVSSSGK